jgi:Glycosyl hydrolase family 20, domain 2
MILNDLPRGAFVFIDANIFVYHFSGVSAECRTLLKRVERTELRAATGAHIVLKAFAASVLLFFIACERASAQELKLVPEPKQVQKHVGEFTITQKTRIVINAAHSDEERTAAETLVEKIESATGLKLKITTAKSLPRSGVVYLARVGDDKHLASKLEASGLAIDDKFNDEGYVLDANTERVVVAARTGEGVF